MAIIHSYPLLIVGLYGFCLYHAFKNGAEQKWYWIILFFPIIGSLIYLYVNFYSKENVESLADGVVSTVNKNHTIKKLEQTLEFSPSITNKSNLADEHVKRQNYNEAEKLYLSCLEGFNKNDVSINQKLLACYFKQGDYQKAISIGEKIEGHRDFKNSENRILFAKALAKMDLTVEAELHFIEMNTRYSNYPHRLAYIAFLKTLNRSKEANEIIERIENEWHNMNRQERKSINKYKQSLESLKD